MNEQTIERLLVRCPSCSGRGFEADALLTACTSTACISTCRQCQGVGFVVTEVVTKRATTETRGMR